MDGILDDVRAALKEAATEERRQSSQRFFKEEIRCYGVASADVTKIAKRAFTGIKQQPKERIFALCEDLWQSGMLEEGGVACLWSHALEKRYEPGDMAVFGRWIDDYISNWASCDTLCNHSVGSLVTMYPELAAELVRWAASPNRWKKRAAAVSLIIPARKGLFLEEVFAIAERLLTDPDDMVQKGYGWMLKAASQAHQDAVFAYVMDRKEAMPRTAFRYALEKMPQELRAQAMKK